MNEKLPPGVCCHPWYNATGEGTDNEGYDCAISENEDSEYIIGLIYERVKFCPWCGAKK